MTIGQQAGGGGFVIEQVNLVVFDAVPVISLLSQVTVVSTRQK